MTRLTRLDHPLVDRDLELVRRNHHEAIRDLQRSPLAAPVVIHDVKLADGALVLVAHRLGRTPSIVIPSLVRGATATGRIDHVDAEDRAGFVALRAIGWGASTIEVDLLVA